MRNKGWITKAEAPKLFTTAMVIRTVSGVALVATVFLL